MPCRLKSTNTSEGNKSALVIIEKQFGVLPFTALKQVGESVSDGYIISEIYTDQIVVTKGKTKIIINREP